MATICSFFSYLEYLIYYVLVYLYTHTFTFLLLLNLFFFIYLFETILLKIVLILPFIRSEASNLSTRHSMVFVQFDIYFVWGVMGDCD